MRVGTCTYSSEASGDFGGVFLSEASGEDAPADGEGPDFSAQPPIQRARNNSTSEAAWDALESLKDTVHTALVVHIAMPAFNFAEHINFKLHPQSRVKVIDGIDDFLQHLAHELTPDLMLVEKDSTEFRLEQIGKRAIAEFRDWHAKLHSIEKLVQEWKSKVERATGIMNKMRDAYYRELFHLREQVYQKKEAGKNSKGAEYQPNYAIHFDPSEYTIDNEVARLVADKIAFMRQEFENRQNEMDKKYQKRIQSLTETLKSSKMLLSRKEVLCKKLMDELGIKDEEALESASKAQALAKEHAKWFGPKSFLEFVNRTWGSMKEAREAIERVWSSRESMGLQEFESFLEAIAYTLDEPQKAFFDLAGGSPVLTLKQLFECIDPGEGRSGSKSKPPRPEKTMSSDSPVVKDAFDPFKFNEEDDLRLGADLEDFGKSDSDDSNDGDDFQSGISDDDSSRDKCSVANSKHGSVVRAKNKLLALVPKRRNSGASCISKSVRPRASSIIVRKTSFSTRAKADMSTMTTVSYDSGIQEAFSTEPAIAITRNDRQTKDAGTDCRPYKEAYPKVRMVSRSCQSQINGDMLRKAMDYFDEKAELLWNTLAGNPADSDSDTETTAEAQGETGSTFNTSEQSTEADKGGELNVARRVQTFDMGDMRYDGKLQLFKKRFQGRNVFRNAEVQVGCGPQNDCSIQCCMKDVSVLKTWFPTDEDPFELQLEAILDIGSSMEAGLPDLRSWAERLGAIYATYAHATNDRDRDVIDKLNRFRSANFSCGSAGRFESPLKPVIAQLSDKPPSERTVADLLKGHGVFTAGESTEAERNTFTERITFTERNTSMERNTYGSKEKAPNERPSFGKRRMVPARAMRHCKTAPFVPDVGGFDSDSSDGGDVSALLSAGISARRGSATTTGLAKTGARKQTVDSTQLILGKARRRSLENDRSGTTDSTARPSTTDNIAKANAHDIIIRSYESIPTPSPRHSFGELESSNDKTPGWSGVIGESPFEKRSFVVDKGNSLDKTDDTCTAPTESNRIDLRDSNVQTPGWSGLVGEPSFEKRNVPVERGDSAERTDERGASSRSMEKTVLRRHSIRKGAALPAANGTVDMVKRVSLSEADQDLGCYRQTFTFDKDDPSPRSCLRRHSKGSQEEAPELTLGGGGPNLLAELQVTDLPLKLSNDGKTTPDRSSQAASSTLKKLPRLNKTPRVETPSRQSLLTSPPCGSPRPTDETQHGVASLSLPEDVGPTLRVTAERSAQKHDTRGRFLLNRPKTCENLNRPGTGHDRHTFGSPSELAKQRPFDVKDERKTFTPGCETPVQQDEHVDMFQNLVPELPPSRGSAAAAKHAPLRRFRKGTAQ